MVLIVTGNRFVLRCACREIFSGGEQGIPVFVSTEGCCSIESVGQDDI